MTVIFDRCAVISWDSQMAQWYSTCQYRRCRRHRFDPWVRKIPWIRKWQPTPVFFPGKFHGQRSLADYSPCGHRVHHDWVTEHACMKWYPIVVLICISLIIISVDSLFMFLLAICVSWWKCLFRSSSIFWLGWIFLKYWVVWAIYIFLY